MVDTLPSKQNVLSSNSTCQKEEEEEQNRERERERERERRKKKKGRKTCYCRFLYCSNLQRGGRARWQSTSFHKLTNLLMRRVRVTK
jgi:hypothetical protein